MGDTRIPEILLIYCQFHTESRNAGKPYSGPGNKLKNNLISLGIPVDMFEHVTSDHKYWKTKYGKIIKKFNKTHLHHFRVSRKKIKIRSDMSATLSNKSSACIICGFVNKSGVILKSHSRHKQQKWLELLVSQTSISKSPSKKKKTVVRIRLTCFARGLTSSESK